MEYAKLKEIASIYFALVEKSEVGEAVKVITPNGLRENNVVVFGSEFVVKEKISFLTQLAEGDIIIKRLSPLFVNCLEEINQCVYLLNNAIAIRVISEQFNPKYIAFILGRQLDRLNSEANSGTRFSAVNRKMIEEIDVPIESLARQQKIGELWRLRNKHQQLLSRLATKENEKSKLIYNQLIRQAEGKYKCQQTRK